LCIAAQAPAVKSTPTAVPDIPGLVGPVPVTPTPAPQAAPASPATQAAPSSTSQKCAAGEYQLPTG